MLSPVKGQRVTVVPRKRLSHNKHTGLSCVAGTTLKNAWSLIENSSLEKIHPVMSMPPPWRDSCCDDTGSSRHETTCSS